MTTLLRRMFFAFWITREEYRNTFVIFSTYCFSTATMVMRTRLSVKPIPHLRTISADSPPRDRIQCTVSTATWLFQSNKRCRGENLKLQYVRGYVFITRRKERPQYGERVWKRRLAQRQSSVRIQPSLRVTCRRMFQDSEIFVRMTKSDFRDFAPEIWHQIPKETHKTSLSSSCLNQTCRTAQIFSLYRFFF